jgi:Zn-dependent protease with chaperone function
MWCTGTPRAWWWNRAVLNVGLGLALALGDVSTMVSMGASLLTGLAYRRGHEVEADCFAAALMRQAQLPTAPMADLLLDMEARRHDQKPQREGEGGGAVARLLSSHPQTAERARMLKQGQLQGCPS